MRKLLSILILTLFFSSTRAQTTAIPDSNFEQELINLGLDTIPMDGNVLTANIDTLTNLSIINKNITDLTGIEDFSALEILNCSNNQLPNLNVTQNTALTYLNCAQNQLTSIDLSQNISLVQLHCYDNQIIALDITQNNSLSHLVCWLNQLTGLDVSQNTSLIWLDCMFNQITGLNINQNPALTFLQCNDNDINALNISNNSLITELYVNNNRLNCLNIKNGNNTLLTDLRTSSNPNLTCIEVDDVNFSNTNWTGSTYFFDNWASFSTSCSNSCAVSVGKEISNKSNLYPNPTIGSINIELGEVLENPTVIISNNLGQIISTKDFKTTSFINVNLNAPKGIYFIQIKTKNREFIRKKILKK